MTVMVEERFAYARCGVPGSLEIETQGHQVRARGPEYRVLGSHGMNPIEHDARAVGPVPVEADRYVVVLPSFEASSRAMTRRAFSSG